MTSDDLPLLIFTMDGDVEVFRDCAAAAGWLESIDVLDGEYPAAYSVDGHITTLVGQRNGPVQVNVTDDVDRDGLIPRLAIAKDRLGFAADPEAPRLVAAELLTPAPKRLRWPWRRRS